MRVRSLGHNICLCSPPILTIDSVYGLGLLEAGCRTSRSQSLGMLHSVGVGREAWPIVTRLVSRVPLFPRRALAARNPTRLPFVAHRAAFGFCVAIVEEEQGSRQENADAFRLFERCRRHPLVLVSAPCNARRPRAHARIAFDGIAACYAIAARARPADAASRQRGKAGRSRCDRVAVAQRLASRCGRRRGKLEASNARVVCVAGRARARAPRACRCMGIAHHHSSALVPANVAR